MDGGMFQLEGGKRRSTGSKDSGSSIHQRDEEACPVRRGRGRGEGEGGLRVRAG